MASSEQSKYAEEFMQDFSSNGRETAKKLGMDDAMLQKCKETYLRADADANGKVSVSELRAILDSILATPMTDAEFDAEVTSFDDNHDGVLDFDEFLRIICNTKAYQSDHLNEMITCIGQETRKEMVLDRMTPEQKLRAEGVPTARVMKYIQSEITQMQACIQLPIAIAIFVAFAMSVLLHERAETLFSVDQAISMDIEENANFAFAGNVPFENGRIGGKNIFDVNTYADFWSWFSMGLIPLFWADGWDLNEVRTNVAIKCQSMRQKLRDFGWPASVLPTNDKDAFGDGPCPEGTDKEVQTYPKDWFGTPRTPSYLAFFSVVAGMRMRQERTDPFECPAQGQPYKGKVHSGACVPEPGYWLRPEVKHSLFMKEELIDHDKTVYLASRLPQADIRHQIRNLENEAWMDPYTAKVELLYTLYNPHIDSFSAVYIAFFVNRAGHFYRMVQPVSFWLNPYHGWWNYLVDGIWLALVAKIFLEEVFTFVQLAKKKGLEGGFRSYLGFGQFNDFLNIGYTIAICVLWLKHLTRLGNLTDYLQLANVETPGSFQDDKTRAAYFTEVADIVDETQSRRLVVALYPFLLVSRFFKAFSAQPRLSLVTSTLTCAAKDLFHFGLVFGSMFGLFTLSAMILFGQELDEFTNINRAADNVFHILLGDFDWDLMRSVGRMPATLWFWSFMVLINLVMLNMLLAIVMDVYTEVRGAIGSNSETLWSQTYEIYRRRRDLRAGLRVSLKYIESCIDTKTLIGEDGNLTGMTNVGHFMEMVPGLQDDQARRILTSTLIEMDEEKVESQSVAEALLGVPRIETFMGRMHESLQNLVHITEMSVTAKPLVIPEAHSARTRSKTKEVPDKTEEKMQPGYTEDSQEPPAWFRVYAERQEQLTQDVANLANTARANELKLNDISGLLLGLDNKFRGTYEPTPIACAPCSLYPQPPGVFSIVRAAP